VTTTQWAEVADSVPPHCLATIAKVARECARTWSEIGEMIDSG
jgi:hypothetical protein